MAKSSLLMIGTFLIAATQAFDLSTCIHPRNEAHSSCEQFRPGKESFDLQTIYTSCSMDGNHVVSDTLLRQLKELALTRIPVEMSL
jgi:hypothetical protein